MYIHTYIHTYILIFKALFQASSVRTGTIYRRLACPLSKDDEHESKMVNVFMTRNKFISFRGYRLGSLRQMNFAPRSRRNNLRQNGSTWLPSRPIGIVRAVGRWNRKPPWT